MRPLCPPSLTHSLRQVSAGPPLRARLWVCRVTGQVLTRGYDLEAERDGKSVKEHRGPWGRRSCRPVG